MATTTNYSWTTPDDTALVKDGASAIRTLVSSVDTTVKALNPGTTSGDEDYYTAATTKARIAKGTAGQVFTMNSGATAPEWATPSSGGMTLISTTTFNGTPTTVLSSIPQTYNNLRIVIRQALPATDATELRMRLNNDATANRYRSDTFALIDGATWTFNDTYGLIGISYDNAVTQSMAIIDIPDYTNTSTWKQYTSYAFNNNSTTSTSVNIRLMMGVYNQTTAISSLGFFFSSGNATSGSILLYGVK